MGYPKLTPITATGGTAPRYLGDRFADFVNVKDYGAQGDGVTDDTAAFEAAAETGRPVFIPDGGYVLADSVSGSFFGTSGARTSKPLDMHCISEGMRRGGLLSGQGSHLFELPYNKSAGVTNWGRAIQGFAYDKYDDVLYCQAAYHINSIAQSELVYAFKYSDKTLLGTNYNADSTYKGSLFDRFSHQNMALYRPSAEDEPLFFSSGPGYTAPNVKDVNNPNKLRLLRWDYANPTVCEIVKEWSMFDLSTYTIETPDVCISEDGSILCALAKHTANNVKVIAVWNVADILEATENTNIQSLATHIFESPFGNVAIGGQGTACDKDYFYGLRSGSADGTPHHIFGIDINTGHLAFLRDASWEGYELPLESILGVECEAINFIPVNSKMKLCLAGTVKYASDYKVPHFYNLEDPSKPLTSGIRIRHAAGATGTSEDVKYLKYGKFYLTSGAMTDFSDGAWTLDDQFLNEYGTNRLQIAQRANAGSYRMQRVLEGGTWGSWVKYLFDYSRGTYGTLLPQFDANDNHSIFFTWLAKRDDAGQSCCYMQRYRENKNQGVTAGSSTYIGIQENTNWLARLGIGSSYTVSSGSVSLLFTVYPAHKITDSNNRTVTAASNLGSQSNPWDNAYITSGQISTSDVRLKDNVEAPSDALMRAWGKVNFKVFQMKEALQAKGENARIHVGVIAQEVQAAFASEGLDAGRYGLFCYDRWEDKYDDVDVVDEPAVYDEDGKELSPAKTHIEKQLVAHGGDKYSIRYEEALALECAYQRWRLEQLEELVNQLTNNTNN